MRVDVNLYYLIQDAWIIWRQKGSRVHRLHTWYIFLCLAWLSSINNSCLAWWKRRCIPWVHHRTPPPRPSGRTRKQTRIRNPSQLDLLCVVYTEKIVLTNGKINCVIYYNTIILCWALEYSFDSNVPQASSVREWRQGTRMHIILITFFFGKISPAIEVTMGQA